MLIRFGPIYLHYFYYVNKEFDPMLEFNVEQTFPLLLPIVEELITVLSLNEFFLTLYD